VGFFFVKWSTQLKEAFISVITSLTDDGAGTVSETVFVWLTICENFAA
jgi:hypothetical protein